MSFPRARYEEPSNTGIESSSVFLGINVADMSGGKEVVDDFTTPPMTTTTIPGWIVSATNGTVAASAVSTGVDVFTTAAGAGDTIQIQGSPVFQPTSGSKIAGECLLKVDTLVGHVLFFGLATVDTTIGALTATEMIGLCVDAADSNIDMLTLTAGGSEKTDSTIDMVANTYIKLGFRVEGTSKVKFYINGAYVGENTTYISTNPLAPSLSIIHPAGAARNLSVDWIRVSQDAR